MSREYKFRAWDRKSGQIVSADMIEKLLDGHELSLIGPLDLTKDHSPEEVTPGRLIRGNPFKMTHFELMQYTGLKDKNGVEIYEGDIIRLTNKNPELVSVVCWNHETAAFAAREPEKSEPYCDHMFGANLCEVVGNIHENPELVK